MSNLTNYFKIVENPAANKMSRRESTCPSERGCDGGGDNVSNPGSCHAWRQEIRDAGDCGTSREPLDRWALVKTEGITSVLELD